MSGVLAITMQQDEDILAFTTASEAEGSPAQDASSSPTHPPGTLPFPVPSLPDIPFIGTPPVGELLAIPTWKKQHHSPSGSLGNRCNIRTQVEARSEHSSAQGEEDTPKLVPEAGPSFNQQQGQVPTNPSFSPSRATTDPDDGTVAGSLRSTSDQVSFDSDSSREDVANSDMDTASGECITSSDTDEVTIQTVEKKYQKRVWASCRLSKGSLWTEGQLKRIGNSYQVVWGHNHESIQAEWDCPLAEDCNSFEMHRMMVRTDQLLHICNSHWLPNLHQRLRDQSPWQGKDSGSVPERIWCPLLLFLWKWMTRAMVSLQGLHLSNAFRCFNVSSSVDLKSFCPWCFKLGGNTKTIVTHLREVHYWLPITCDLCKSFASMSVQIILDDCSGCKAKYVKECAEQARYEVQKSHKKKSKAWEQEKSFPKLVWVALMNHAWQNDAWHLPSNSADENGLIHPWDLPKSLWPCMPCGFLLNCMNCYVLF